MSGGTVNVGANIKEIEPALIPGQGRTNSGAIDTSCQAEQPDTHGHERAGIAGTDTGPGATLGDLLKRSPKRRRPLIAQRAGGWFILQHHLGTKHHLITPAYISIHGIKVPSERGGKLRLAPVQGHFDFWIVLKKALDGGDGDSRTTVSAHGIDC